ncbi:MAG: MotA/TolQ/ExbB proton channel family protein [Bacteroidia bacterium]
MPGILLQITTSTASTIADTVAAASNGIQAVTEPVITKTEFSLFSMVMKGGVMMVPLGILLVLTIYVLVERLITISKSAKKNPNLVPSVKDLVHKGNIDAARAMCKSMNTPEAAMVEKGLTRIGQPMQEIREAMTESATVELGRLEKNLSILNITGRIAPMFGFVGTIIGVIKIFYDIALQGTVEIEVISTGLYQKMVSSAGGLVVGVLAFIFYHWMNSRIDAIARRMEETKMKFLDILNEPAK